MTADLSGKTALVTGASSGLGAHFATVLASAGTRVILAARREAALAEVSALIVASGGDCSTLTLDVTSADAVQAAAEVIGTCDIVVNNAGLVLEGAAIDATETDWDTVLDTNVKGMFLVAQAAARGMRTRGAEGSIINIASILGLRQAGNVASYAVSKAAAIQLTRTLALEWARYGVRVNALAPGYIETDLNQDFWAADAGKALIKRIPQRRLGRASDLDGPLLLLASNASAFMTGSVITVDGGHLVSTL